MKIWPDLTIETLIQYLMKSPAVDDVGQDAVKATMAYWYLHADKVGVVLTHQLDWALFI